MKYIRTKNDISIIETTLTDNKELFDYLLQFSNYKDNLIKVSDNIEELFECVVYDCLPRPHQSPYHKHEIGDVESLEWNKKPERFENIYGAIYTDKGIIYKAKMKGVSPNGEIEWELL